MQDGEAAKHPNRILALDTAQRPTGVPDYSGVRTLAEARSQLRLRVGKVRATAHREDRFVAPRAQGGLG